MERAVAGSADVIAEMITLGTDLMFRHLVDRDDLSASAALVLNRISREGPMRLTALAAAEAAHRIAADTHEHLTGQRHPDSPEGMKRERGAQ